MQEESDLEKKRREAEALLQSMGLTPEAPIGKGENVCVYRRDGQLPVPLRHS